MKLDNAAMTFGGSALTVRKTAVDAPKAKTISDTYGEHQKLVFLFDASGSMSQKVATDKYGATFTDAFIWTPEKLDEIGQACSRTVQKVSDFNIGVLTGALDPDEDDPALDELESRCLRLCRENMFAAPAVPTESEIKERIVRNDATAEFGILPSLGKRQEPPSRMDLVKRLASAEITARFKKFPNARVAVVAFGGNALTLFDDGDAAQVDAAVAQLDANGMNAPVTEGSTYAGPRVDNSDTNIMGAVSAGMNICRAKPSAVGLHHFILVSDGGAYTSLNSWVPNLKASGIVLDYIHIGDHYINDDVKAACAATGGEFVVCNTEKDIAEKFTLAATRLCLPPAPGK